METGVTKASVCARKRQKERTRSGRCRLDRLILERTAARQGGRPVTETMRNSIILVVASISIVVGLVWYHTPSREPAGPATATQAAPTKQVDVLSPADQTGLLGAPLPAGARLVERSDGDPANEVDPSEKYEIQATVEQIMAFFDDAMNDAGWQADGPAQPTARFFTKGSLMIGVLSNRDGGGFNLMGS